MDKYTLKTIFEESFSGLIWRIEADPGRAMLAIETRNPESGIPYFSVINYESGEVLVFEQPYGGRYWTLAGINHGHVLLRAMGEQEPNGSGIACLSALTGELLWEKFNLTFVALRGQVVIAHPHHLAGGYYRTFLSLHDGEQLEQFPAAENEPTVIDIAIPEQTDRMEAGIRIDYPIVGSLHRHIFGDKEVWAFHIAENNTFAVKLLVTKDKKILEDRVIMPKLKKMTPEIFFAIDRQLFFIDGNKQKFVSYLV